MRVMAIDYGDARTGVAISDPSGLLTGFTTVIHSRKRETVLAQLAALCKERGADRLVMGFPRNMDGTEGFRAERTRRFASLVAEKTGVKVMFTDERLSTVEAYTYMNITGVPGSKRKGKIDALSAQIILQSFLDSQKNG